MPSRSARNCCRRTQTAVTVRGGEVVGPRGSISLGEIARTWYLKPQNLPSDVDSGGLEATIGYKPARDSGTFSYATHAALVAVDPEIGDVEILDYVIVEDGGKLVNPMIVDGQIYGGFAQGIGTALYEEMPFDISGQPLASTFADYLLPGPTEVPAPRLDHMETPRSVHGVRSQGHRRRRRDRPARGDRQRRERCFAAVGRGTAPFADHAATDPGGHCAGGPEHAVKPVRFDYERPNDLATALTLGGREDTVVKFLAGGQSLGPMLNLRLVQPDLLVDITRDCRAQADRGNRGLNHDRKLHYPCRYRGWPCSRRDAGALRTVAAGIAYRAVRNRGTIGGQYRPCRSLRGLAFGPRGAGRVGHRARRPRRPPHADRDVHAGGVREQSEAWRARDRDPCSSPLSHGALGLPQGVSKDRRICPCDWRVRPGSGSFRLPRGDRRHGRKPIVLTDADGLFTGNDGTAAGINVETSCARP